MSLFDHIPRPLRRFLAFNLTFRDKWVSQQAGLLPAGTRILDVGAGSCHYRNLFRHCEYRSQDFSTLAGGQLRDGGYGAIDYVCDATKIPVEDGSFDAILCTEMLEHVHNPVAVVNELSRILRPDGRLILTAPLGSGIHQEPYHFYGGYTPYWYEKFLHEAGFVDIRVEPNGGFFRHYGQESLRFLQLTRPGGALMPMWVSVLMVPLWLMLLPVLGIFFPLLCDWLDRFDTKHDFTVGYHVTAKRMRPGTQ